MGISAKDFAAMRARIDGRAADAGRGRAVEAPVRVAALAAGTVVLGIDPSLRGTGWGVVRVEPAGPLHLGSGTIRCPAGWERSRCLAEISRVLDGVVAAHRPLACACEGLFFAQNLQTALVMGEARGAALARVAAAEVPVYEIAPRRAKRAIVGYGAARKPAVAAMVRRLLALDETPAPDAADALALALAFIQTGGGSALVPARRV